MKSLFWSWTVLCIMATAGVTLFFLKDQAYTGTDLTFNTDSSHIIVLNTPATVEAVSCGYFLFLKSDAEPLAGSLSLPDKPLGWRCNLYFKLSPSKMSVGEWYVQTGEGITLHLKSEQAMQVQYIRTLSDKVLVVFLLGLCGIGIWMLGLLLGSSKY